MAAAVVLMSGGGIWAQEIKLPDAPGKATFQKACSSCHGAATVLGMPRTKTGWEQIVEDMVSRGAEVSEDDAAAIVSYLSEKFGKINVNSASARDLEKALDLPAQEAQAIVAYREKNGKINAFEDLQKVPGVSADKLQAKRARIAYTD